MWWTADSLLHIDLRIYISLRLNETQEDEMQGGRPCGVKRPHNCRPGGRCCSAFDKTCVSLKPARMCRYRDQALRSAIEGLTANGIVSFRGRRACVAIPRKYTFRCMSKFHCFRTLQVSDWLHRQGSIETQPSASRAETAGLRQLANNGRAQRIAEWPLRHGP